MFEELISMYKSSLEEAQSLWLSHCCCSSEEACERKEEDEKNGGRACRAEKGTGGQERGMRCRKR